MVKNERRNEQTNNWMLDLFKILTPCFSILPILEHCICKKLNNTQHSRILIYMERIYKPWAAKYVQIIINKFNLIVWCTSVITMGSTEKIDHYSHYFLIGSKTETVVYGIHKFTTSYYCFTIPCITFIPNNFSIFKK